MIICRNPHCPNRPISHFMALALNRRRNPPISFQVFMEFYIKVTFYVRTDYHTDTDNGYEFWRQTFEGSLSFSFARSLSLSARARSPTFTHVRYTHTRMHVHTHTHTRMHTHSCMHTCTRARTHIYIYIYIYVWVVRECTRVSLIIIISSLAIILCRRLFGFPNVSSNIS